MFMGLPTGVALTLAVVLTVTAPTLAAPRVVATIVPLHGLAAAVMDGVATPELLLKRGASPHAYALRPSDARALHRARVIFWIGPALETFLVRPLGTLGRGARVVALADAPGITRIGTDPHIWLDPANARVIVTAMAETLAAVNPAHAAAYRANAGRTNRRIRALDHELNAALGPVRGLTYVVFHDAYQYFQRRYRVPHAAALTVSPERAPGARRLRQVRRTLTRGGVRCAFAEPGMTPAVMQTLVRGTKARIATLDPLGVGLAPGPGAWFALMRGLAKSLVACLARGRG